ncbi:MAG TPA: hypothetical protein VGJ75_04200, partial [Dongiaceae bacterium]
PLPSCLSAGRFPPPWSAEDTDACFIVRDANGQGLGYVYFTNRPFWVKRFQTIHHYSVDVARGLALLFGIGTKALVWGFLCQGIRQGRAGGIA